MKAILEAADPAKLLSVMAAVRDARKQAVPLPEFPIAILNNFTANGLAPFLDFHGLRAGLDIKASFGDFDVIAQQIIDRASPLHQAQPRLVVLALIWDMLDDPYARTRDLLELARANLSCPVMLNTFVPMVPDDRVHVVNAWLRAQDVLLSDWEAHAQELGRTAALDRRYWYMAKAPFQPPFLSLWAADIARTAAGLAGLGRKCLVLDCDNTLWGGVLGEEGVTLHPHDYPGNVFHQVQSQVARLAERGVVVALCSKNNEADVWEIFDTHPNMALSRRHIAAWRINWDNKAENLTALAAELNLGLDSFVFVDDSPFEIEQVKARLPQVRVLQVPANPYDYPQALAALVADCFPPSRTAEDAARLDHYQARRQAEDAKAAFADMGAYLASLELKADMHAMRADEVARVAQLTGKTNQFNLDKHPLSEAEVQALLDAPDARAFVMVVADKFANLGLTNVCIVRRQGDEAVVDTMLMSCRVFERGLEYAFLDYVLKRVAALWNVARVRGRFVPSAKNKVAENFYDRAGFTPLGAGEYLRELAGFAPAAHAHIRIEEGE